MTEFNPYHNWKWFGPSLWLTVHFDHRFEFVSSNQTRMKFVLDASGFGVGFFGPIFARIYSRNLERSTRLLVKAMEQATHN